MNVFFSVLRYLFIFFISLLSLTFNFSYASELLSRQLNSVGDTSWGWTYKSYKESEIIEECKASRPDDKIKRYILIHMNSALPNTFYSHFKVLWYSYGSGECKVTVNFFYSYSPIPPKESCETPKTDDQCNKGASSWVEGNAAFWASAGASGTGYKGCTFEKVPDGLGFKFPDGSESHTVKSTGSTGKSWCETTPSEPPVPESEFPNNPNLTPATDPKECKSGWIKTSTGQYYCVASGAEPTPPSTNPDGSINSDKDGNPSPPDANAGKPPIGGGTDPDGGGDGECEGENCEGGGGTKPPARPDDPWSSVLDANDLSQLQADKADVEAELNSFYEQVRNSIRINIGSPSTAPMPSYGFIEQGGERVELSMSWLDSVDMEGRSAVILLCGLIAASIIFWGRP